MTSGPKIAIIGAGPAGLTLAKLLQRSGIHCAIYELESGPSERNQGGTLDIHSDSGQLALREAGLFEEFKKKARPEGEALKLVSPTGRVLWNENGSAAPNDDAGVGDRPEIDRLNLRNLLMNSLEPDTIHWGKKLKSVEPGSNDTYDLHFADGVEESFDLVVGADGGWSKVRPLLTDKKPFYSGITLIELWALDVDILNSWLSEYVGAGSCAMFDEGRALICQRNGNGSIRAYACVRQSETWVKDCTIDWARPEVARKQLVDQYFGDCGEDLKRMILGCEDELIPRVLYMLPIGLEWEQRPGLTVLGDAAHLMTVFAGVGVNVAMHDALDLATAIASCKQDWISSTSGSERTNTLAAATRRYEVAMFERGKENAQDTWNQMHMCFSAGGGEAMIEMMKGRGAPSAEPPTG